MVCDYMDQNGVGKLVDMMGKIYLEQYCEILMKGWRKALKSWKWKRMRGHSNKTVTPNTPSKG
jgi:hypothetical protein